MPIPRSFRILAYAALVCVPLSCLAFYYVFGWATVLYEDVDKSFMSETPGFEYPLAERIWAYVVALPGFLILAVPMAVGGLLPLVVLVVACVPRLFAVISLRAPGIVLFLFLCLCSAGVAFVSIISLPFGGWFIPLAAFTAVAAFQPIIPSFARTSSPNA